MNKKRYLFFIVHPSKYHVFRHTINILKAKGHQVDLVITSKDVLEKLIENENWAYKNIFPEGRKIRWLPTYLGAAFNAIRTLYRLEKFVWRTQYNLFITDDLLVINGFLHKIPSVLFQDDDVTAVPESQLLHRFATHIMTQFVSNMGKFSVKKVPFHGYKELGSLHPKRFTPNQDVVLQFNPSLSKYFIIRLVSLNATHDTGKSGLTDEDVLKLIDLLESYGKVFITSERKLPSKFEKYRINIKVNELAHALYFADFLIADSQTMSAEAGVLGTPYIRFNDFVGRISYLEELEHKYELGYGIKTKDKNLLFSKVYELLNTPDLKEKWKKKRSKMLSEKIDLTDFMVWFFENYPESNTIIKNFPDFQLKYLY
ncbi:MAG: hypothetical protein FJX80_00975 [Bacteroidetes bacterium]|nr:hypothetical protein [Bacteroidota bacterium]